MGEAALKLKLKKEAFEKNPNDFIHRSDVIVGIVKEDDGVAPTFSTKVSRTFLISALYDLAHQGDMYIRSMDRAMAEKNNPIITPGDNGKSRIVGL